ncbi:hypothetical protein MKW94_005079 [Papaver nudicaule]|uniref:E3 ubiquitin-protein ligase FANCL n=1 Tax=Papaver nudicaule TaxID=74823 RepID=A0AA41RYI1_PAPNU|nr:hypothetical protein [Papaver nudicaule]
MSRKLNQQNGGSSSSSFHGSVYSEIEEVGWEHLVHLSEDLTFMTFRILDKKGQSHIFEIYLPQSYPKCAPSVSADMPYVCKLKWSMTSRLKDIVLQLHEHLEKLQDFLSTMDDIDKNLWVVGPIQPSRATSFRQINLGNDCFIVLAINVYDPRSLPECRLLGPEATTDNLRKRWKRNCTRWTKDKSIGENLENLMETSLPGPRQSIMEDQQVECGICYAHCLPVNDELGAKSGSGSDYTCDNGSCRRAFHSVCLGDWLRSITTTRQSFDVLFGNCPYCLGPVAVKVDSNV